MDFTRIVRVAPYEKLMDTPFFNFYTHGFARVAVAVPVCRVADPEFNAAETIKLAAEASELGAAIVAFPELGLSAYTCDDLFHQHALLDASERALELVVAASRDFHCAVVVGLPIRVNHLLFNCAAVVANGKIHGVVPKSYLPNYGEFYEGRQFSPADSGISVTVPLLGFDVPFGTDLLFKVEGVPLITFHVEICEDVWVPIPPSSYACLAGATVLVNLSASNVIIGKADYRRQLVRQQSARCLAAYLYSSSGQGESSTDMAWDGHALICENGETLCESERFKTESQLIYTEIDLERLSHERMRHTTFSQSVRHHRSELQRFRTVIVPLSLPINGAMQLSRTVERFPYVPSDQTKRDERCQEVYNIQVQALAQRLFASKISKVVIGISGGLDSTHALLVCAHAMDKLKLPRSNILGVTMPGFATSERTLSQARRLMADVGCTASEIDIRPSCMQMLKDIGHPYALGEEAFDVTFENVQAGERTSHLFRIANLTGGIVLGTGDLSELALGWCTYGVGDHMSHYNVNASVPKTLISHLVRWVAESDEATAEGSLVLSQIVDTEISPELVPGSSDLQPAQRSETVIGPYELQDFNLYYILRYGFSPAKVAFLALYAWGDVTKGAWPYAQTVKRNEYALPAIKKYLGVFVDRFFRTTQFKRSCVPNGPKVGSGGSLSPRGDWRAPSDSESKVWFEEVQRIPD